MTEFYGELVLANHRYPYSVRHTRQPVESGGLDANTIYIDTEGTI